MCYFKGTRRIQGYYLGHNIMERTQFAYTHYSDERLLSRSPYRPCTENAINILRAGLNGRQFADGIFKYICMNKTHFFSIKQWFLSKFHGFFFLRTNLTISPTANGYGNGFDAEQATRHYLNQWWPSSGTHICVIRSQCADIYIWFWYG